MGGRMTGKDVEGLAASVSFSTVALLLCCCCCARPGTCDQKLLFSPVGREVREGL